MTDHAKTVRFAERQMGNMAAALCMNLGEAHGRAVFIMAALRTLAQWTRHAPRPGSARERIVALFDEIIAEQMEADTRPCDTEEPHNVA